MDTIRCPHCGGQSRNFSVCDYCGSIITPTNNEEPIEKKTNSGHEKLKKAVQDNLNEQIKCQGKNHVTTTMSVSKNKISLINPTAIEDFVEMPNDVTVYPKNPLNVTQKTSLILRVVLHDAELDKVVLGDVDYDVNERIDAKERYEWFIKSGVSKLFTKADVAEHSQEKDIACSKIYHAYFLDCGHDSVATANIIWRICKTLCLTPNRKESI